VLEREIENHINGHWSKISLGMFNVAWHHFWLYCSKGLGCNVFWFFFFFYIFERSFICSPRLHLFDPKYSKNSNMVTVTV